MGAHHPVQLRIAAIEPTGQQLVGMHGRIRKALLQLLVLLEDRLQGPGTLTGFDLGHGFALS
ncbi:hypothetical protein GCM10009594_19420 [Kocuria palustris]